jgi:hypothetical protein
VIGKKGIKKKIKKINLIPSKIGLDSAEMIGMNSNVLEFGLRWNDRFLVPVSILI